MIFFNIVFLQAIPPFSGIDNLLNNSGSQEPSRFIGSGLWEIHNSNNNSSNINNNSNSSNNNSNNDLNNKEGLDKKNHFLQKFMDSIKISDTSIIKR